MSEDVKKDAAEAVVVEPKAEVKVEPKAKPSPKAEKLEAPATNVMVTVEGTEVVLTIKSKNKIVVVNLFKGMQQATREERGIVLQWGFAHIAKVAERRSKQK